MTVLGMIVHGETHTRSAADFLDAADGLGITGLTTVSTLFLALFVTLILLGHGKLQFKISRDYGLERFHVKLHFGVLIVSGRLASNISPS